MVSKAVLSVKVEDDRFTSFAQAGGADFRHNHGVALSPLQAG